MSGPVARLALASSPPETAPVLGVRWQLLLNSALASAAPVLGLVLILSAPSRKSHIVAASIVVAIVALVLGATSTALAARAIGEPLRDMMNVLHKVGAGTSTSPSPWGTPARSVCSSPGSTT